MDIRLIRKRVIYREEICMEREYKTYTKKKYI